ncbi:dual specificity protein phosphatase [Rhizobium sp.]|uniref:dual specificity protein phosphatase family protein n=1 Tax=Rhizobium sp. TaxID=391 RepID=UPI000E981083|nr:protein phosphatase [Rhizobium sp.]
MPANETRHYPRPPISLIESNLPGWGIDLYIGGSDAAADPDLLAQHQIKVVFNCAINLDIDLVSEAKTDMPEHLMTHGMGLLRYYKLGLVDGHGNPEAMMLAGYHLLRSALDQQFPEKPSYPRREKGNILVNCRGGRSRSVTLVSLFLHLEFSDRYPTLDAAIAHVRTRRELHPDEWDTAPKPVLIQNAKRAADMANLLKAAGYGVAGV